ncbi:MAG: UPF0158 family protein [Gammaproteobacteria bacterium]|nr:UPF0158 family protein [Gammaproteobacteria bacterium]
MTRGSVRLDDLVEAMDYVSIGEFLDAQAYLCIETGKIHCHTDEYADIEEPLPDDVDDPKKYIPIPNKHELDLGRQLAMRFVEELIPEEFEKVKGFFRRKGAYGRFKDLLDRQGLLERWYQFEEESRKQVLRDWCAENGITCIE